jgi:hypothetical protein
MVEYFNPLRQLICPTGRFSEFVSSPATKNISLFQKRKSAYRIPRPAPWGVSRSSGNVVRDAMDAVARKTSATGADGEVVWS